MLLEILAGCLMGASISIETLGFYLRFAGQAVGAPSVGYSLHVQVATFSRLGTFIGLPLIGWLIDSGGRYESILVIPVVAFLLITSILCAALFANGAVISVSRRLFDFLASVSSVGVGTSDKSQPSRRMTRSEFRSIFLAGYVSFLFVTSGFFVATLFAAAYPNYRATILQCSPAITAIGTFVSVFYFDPRISAHIDGWIDSVDVSRAIVLSRGSAAATLLLVFLALYLNA